MVAEFDTYIQVRYIYIAWLFHSQCITIHACTVAEKALMQ